MVKEEHETDRELRHPDGNQPLVFGEFRIDPESRTLARGDTRIRIQRKPLEVLIFLAEQAPRLVSRQELLERFWSRAVNDESLTRCISTIRKLLDDAGDPPRYIETHRAQGYRFIALVDRNPPPGGTGAPGSRRRSSSPAGAAAETSPGLAGAAAGQARDARTAKRPGRSVIVVVGLLVALAAIVATVFRDSVDGPGATTPTTINRIAVLPIMPAPDDEPWLAPAVTDHLMQAVSRIEGVTVVASGSADVGETPDPQAIGRQLNVEALLLSRLERTPDGSRLSARLISTSDGGILWTSRIDPARALEDGEQVERLARSVANRLRPTLQLQAAPPPVDPKAYREYLRGRYYWSQRSLVGLQAAIQAFDAALAIEPGYADALVGAAESWLLLPLYGAMPPTEAIPRARELADRAMERGPGHAHAHAVLGAIAMQYDWDWNAAETLLRAAVTRNPNDATAQQWLGELYCYRQRIGECRAQLSTALELDPLSPVLMMLQGSPALFAADYTEALATYSTALEEQPGLPLGQYVVGLAHAGLGEWPQAIDAYEAALPDLGLAIVGGPLVHALARQGDVDLARGRLADLESLADERYVPPSKFAVAHLGFDDQETAMEWLGRAVDAHDDRLVYLAVDVHFRALHDNPSFREIAAMVNLQDALDRR